MDEIGRLRSSLILCDIVGIGVPIVGDAAGVSQHQYSVIDDDVGVDKVEY